MAFGHRAVSASCQRPLSADQAAKLVAIEPKSDLDYRDRAILELFYSSGLRLSELSGLDVKHVATRNSSGWVDLKERVAFVTGKGGKERLCRSGGTHTMPCKRGASIVVELPLKMSRRFLLDASGRRLGLVRAIQQRVTGLGQAARSWARCASTHATPLFCQPFAGIER